MIRTGYVHVVSHGYVPICPYIYNVHMLLSIPNTHYISVQIGTVHHKKKTSDGERGETARFVVNAFKCAEPVSGTLLNRASLVRCKRGRWARSRQALLVVDVLQPHAVVPDTVHCCCCIMCHTKIEATKKCRVSRSGLQQRQRCSIMHPSSHPAAQQRCSHAPIRSRQPRSVCKSTWSLSCARYVRECCVLSLCVMRVENLSSYDYFLKHYFS